MRSSQMARFMGPTWGPPGSCQPQIGPILAQWTLLSGIGCLYWPLSYGCFTDVGNNLVGTTATDDLGQQLTQWWIQLYQWLSARLRYLQCVNNGDNEAWCPFCQYGLTLIPAWISDYVHYKVWDAITYLFPNFNSATVEVWAWISNFSHTVLDMWLLIHAGIKVNPC